MPQKIYKRIISCFLIVMLLSSFLPMKAYAGDLPDGLQNFLGYDYTTSPGTANSPDGFFVVTASKSGLIADNFGAFISDAASDTEEQVYIEIRANGTLQSFELESLYVGEFYNSDVTTNGFRNVTVKGYAEGTEVFSTFPYSSPDQGAAYEPNYPINYSVADGIRIDSFRIYYTREIGTSDSAFNLVNFTIAESSETPPQVPTVNSVTVSPSSGSVIQGETTQLTATVDVLGGAATTVSWTSSDVSGKVSVDATGLVSVASDAALGDYTITATSSFDPTKTDTATITVITPPPVPTVNSVTVSPSTATVIQGETTQLTGTIDVSGGAATGVSWTSSDVSGKVSVDATGLVSVASDAALGDYTITATSSFDPTKTDTATITVITPPPVPTVNSVTVSPSTATVIQGETTQLTGTIDVSGGAPDLILWTIEDLSGKVMVNPLGMVLVAPDAVPGEYIIRATAAFDPMKTDTATITVITPPPVPTVNSVTVSPSTATVMQGGTTQLTGTIDVSGGAATGVNWTSSDVSGKVSVDATGLVSVAPDAVPGDYTITATSIFDPTKTDTATITVITPPPVPTVNSVTVSPSTATVIQGGITQLTGTVDVSGGAATGVNWTSSDVSGKVSVDATGLVSVAPDAVPGDYTITATSIFDPTKTDTATITVITPPPVPTVNSVTVSPSTATVMQGGTTQLTGTVIVSGGAFDQLIWMSGDPSGKVMVDPVGMVFVAPDAVPGNYTITATAAFDPTKTDTATITVITPPLVPTVNSVTVSPSSASVMQGESLQMTATVDVSGGALGTIEWDSTDISGKVSVDATGLVSVAADAAPGGYLISAFSLEDPLKFDSALITVTRPPSTSEIISVTVNPASATVNPGGNTQLTATVVKSGEAIGYLIWTTSDVNHKVTVDTTGKVRVAADATPGDYTITATAIENFSKFGTAIIHVAAIPQPPVDPTPSIPVNTPPRQVNVNAGDNTIASIDIVRDTIDDKKVDTVQLDSKKADEIVKDAVDNKQDSIQIVIDDLESDPSDEVLVEINKDSLQQISDAKISLEIKTEDATVSLSGDTVQSLAAEGEDLYFRLIPIRNEDERAAAIENAMSAQIVVNTAGGSEVQVLGTPMVIETNYKDLDTKVVFSLRNITLPTGENELEEFVNSLAVFIEHSDGEKELQRGRIVYDKDGKPVGIEINITKFSTFSIVGIKNAPPEASNLKISGTTLVGNKLRATFDFYDFDNDEKGKTIYQWYRAENAKGKNKQLIKGANASTYTITKEDMGKYIYLVVTPVAKTGELKGEQVAVAASQMVKEKIQYHAHVKLGVVGSKTYAEELAGMFKNTYKAGNVKVVKEGNYYRVYADFTTKANAEKACKELKDKKYIINYYIE